MHYIIFAINEIYFYHVMWGLKVTKEINPLTHKLNKLNFQPLGVEFRWHNPQLQVSEN